MSLKSPCTKVCTMDPDSGFCLGCFRSLEEIGRWTVMSESEREKVAEELPKRRNSIPLGNSES